MLRSFALVLPLLLALARVHAADLGSITVTVVEQGSGALVGGVTVTLLGGVTVTQRGSTPSGENGWIAGPMGTCVTDVVGRCGFPIKTAGSYAVEASGAGYRMVIEGQSSSAMAISPTAQAQGFHRVLMAAGGSQSSSAVKISENAEPRDYPVMIVVYRSAVMTGGVVDQDTNEPIQGLNVTALFLGSPGISLAEVPSVVLRDQIREDGLQAVPAGSVHTDSKGAFRIENLPPGDYKLQIRAEDEIAIAEGWQPDYGEKLPQPRSYGARYWPPGSLHAGSGVSLPSGAAIDFGRIAIEKAALGRIRGRVVGTGCGEDDSYLLYVSAGNVRSSSAVPCGSAYTIERLPPGEYRIEAWRDAEDPGDKEYASTTALLLAGADIEVPIAVAKPLRIIGTAACDCVGPDPVKGGKAVVVISPADRENDSVMRPAHAKVAKDGSFEALACPVPRWEISAPGLGKGYYIDRILYNGGEVSSSFASNLFAGAQSLRVVFSDKTSAIQGDVSEGFSPQANAVVLIAPWPLRRPLIGIRLAESAWEYQIKYADTGGHYMISGLAPGTYHIVATDRTPGKLSQLLESGAEIKLGAGELNTYPLQVKKQ